MKGSASSLFAVTLCAGFTVWAASPQAVGVVRSGGEFRVNNAPVTSNGTLFDGNVVESLKVRTDLVLNGGTQVTFAPNSRGQVFKNRAILQSGAVEISAAPGFLFEAQGLRIAPAGGSARVALVPGKSRVVVSAVRGDVKVHNREGVLVAHLTPGRGLEFDPQAGAAETVKLRGKLQKQNGVYILTDETTKVTVEVRGNDLEKYVGKTITVTGSVVPGAVAGVAAASQVVAITSISVAAAAAGAGAGIGAVALGSIIGGVAAASIAGLAIAGTFSGDDETVSRP